MKKYIKLGLLIIWLGVIYYFSSQTSTDSLNESNGLLEFIANILKVSDIDSFINKYGQFIRELAHFTEFFILGLLICLNIYEYSNKNVILITFVLTALYAISDELHQMFVEGRVCTFKDIVIDTLGGVTAGIISHLIMKYVAKRKSAKLWSAKSNK